MKSTRKSQKPKTEPASAGADAPEKGSARARKEVFDLADADSIHDLMAMNGPRVTKWALECVQKVARGRASLFEQKIALMMIQKCTPSTGRKGEEETDPLPEGATKEEMRAINQILQDHKETHDGATPKPGHAPPRVGPETASYQVKRGAEE
jgi:hypothetical protein